MSQSVTVVNLAVWMCSLCGNLEVQLRLIVDHYRRYGYSESPALTQILTNHV
jgi:hypothetical protein